MKTETIAVLVIAMTVFLLFFVLFFSSIQLAKENHAYDVYCASEDADPKYCPLLEEK